MAFDLKKITGVEDTDLEESNSMPLLRVLQSNSPQVKEIEDAYIEGAKAGMFYLNDHKIAVKGPIEIIPVGFKSCYVEWKPKSVGGGLVAHHGLDAVTFQGYEKGRDKDRPYKEFLGDNDLVRTSYWCVLLNVEGEWENKLIAMTSSQLKVSRALTQKIKSFKYDGKLKDVRPPIFANIWKLDSVVETNSTTQDKYFNLVIKENTVLDVEKDQGILEQAYETSLTAKQEMLPSEVVAPQVALPANEDTAVDGEIF